MGHEDTGQILTAIREMGAELAENVANRVKVDLNEQLTAHAVDIATLKSDVHAQGREIGELKQGAQGGGQGGGTPPATQAPVMQRSVSFKKLATIGFFVGTVIGGILIVVAGG